MPANPRRSAHWRWAGRGIGVIPVGSAGDVFTLNADLEPEWTAPAGGGGATDPEIVRDTIGSALVAGTNIAITVDDPANTITIATTGLTHPQVLARGLGA